jgi:5-methylcytosine-specific restriction endonuclease McrA
MNKRTKACDISTKVRQAIIERDHKQCIFCGSHQMLSVAHYIPRSRGGLGVERNLALACMPCHHKLDQTSYRLVMMRMFKKYLISKYGEFDERTLIYRKGE